MDKTIKTFLLKLLIILAVLVVVDQGMGLAFKWLSEEALERNPYNAGMKTYFMVEKVNADVVIVGASDASHHYIPSMIQDSIGLSVYNCGKDGSFFIYQNCMINLMLERFSPRIIVWEIIEDCLSGEITSNNEYKSINLLYPYYSNDYCRKVINEKDKYQRFRMLSMMFRNSSTLLSICKSLYITQKNDMGYFPIANTGYIYPTLFIQNVMQSINEDKVEILKNTIENCTEHGVKLVFASSPSYTDGAILKTIQYQKLRETIANYHLPFIEFQSKRELFQDSTLFKDVSHLNDKGARVYMNFFIPELKKVINNQQ